MTNLEVLCATDAALDRYRKDRNLPNDTPPYEVASALVQEYSVAFRILSGVEIDSKQGSYADNLPGKAQAVVHALEAARGKVGK